MYASVPHERVHLPELGRHGVGVEGRVGLVGEQRLERERFERLRTEAGRRVNKNLRDVSTVEPKARATRVSRGTVTRQADTRHTLALAHIADWYGSLYSRERH